MLFQCFQGLIDDIRGVNRLLRDNASDVSAQCPLHCKPFEVNPDPGLMELAGFDEAVGKFVELNEVTAIDVVDEIFIVDSVAHRIGAALHGIQDINSCLLDGFR
ncbi:hypothetical protein D3C79_853310 [compost metagenome]